MASGVVEGKAVVVTGAGVGLGAAYAKDLGAEGAKVIVNDIEPDEAERTADEIRAGGGTAVPVVADIRSWDAAEGLINACVSEFGRIDGLVNNAGVYRLATIEEQTEADFRLSIETNVYGVAFCGTWAARHMLRQGSGSIVSASSGAQTGFARHAAYSASKGAIASLTYAWARDLAGTGVRANAISPRGQSRGGERSKAYRVRTGTASVHDTPLPEASANAPVVTFLISDLSADVHGQVVRIDGEMLSLFTHPAVSLPIHRRPSWTTLEVAEAFRADLADRQLPSGISGIRITGIETSEPAWPSWQPV